MKKIIIILVFLAVLLLSGCDAMLEVFYPEFADNYNSDSRVFDISYNLSAFQYGVLVGSGQPLKLVLVADGISADGGTITSPELFYDQNGWWSYFFDTSVNYDAYFWCDVDGNTSLSSGDIVSKTPINIDFSDGSSYKNVELTSTDFKIQ